MTVRRAINILVEQDVVSTAQGKGTFVKPMKLSKFSFQLDELHNLFRDKARTSIKFLDVKLEHANRTVAARLGVLAGRPVRLHRPSDFQG